MALVERAGVDGHDTAGSRRADEVAVGSVEGHRAGVRRDHTSCELACHLAGEAPCRCIVHVCSLCAGDARSPG